MTSHVLRPTTSKGLRDVTNMNNDNTAALKKPSSTFGPRVPSATQPTITTQQIPEPIVEPSSRVAWTFTHRPSLPSSSDPHKATQECGEYLSEIESTLLQAAASRTLTSAPNPLANHAELSANNRHVLVDWLVEVAYRFRLEEETLYLGVNLLDRYLSTASRLPKHQLQLLGTCCLWIASKTQEMRPPEGRDFVYVADDKYRLSELMEMEVKVLNGLKFDVTVATPLQLLYRFLCRTEIGFNTEHRYLAQYLLELTLLDVSFLQKSPLELAAGAAYLTRRLLKLTPSWPEECRQFGGLDEQSVKEVAKLVYAIVPSRESRSMVRSKYAKQKLMGVANRL